MTLDDFLKYVLPDVSGCPSVLAKQQVLEAATEFLTFSSAWNEVQPAVTLIDDVQDYELEAPTGARCIDVKAIYTLAGELKPVTLRQLAQLLPSWQTATGNVPSFYTRAFDFASIKLFPIPEDPAGETITVRGVYTLKDNATAIPDVIVQRYREAIASGAKARLMRMSKVTWSDPVNARMHQDLFDDAKLVAKVTASHDKTTGYITVPSRVFGQ